MFWQLWMNISQFNVIHIATMDAIDIFGISLVRQLLCAIQD
ncbi:MAG: hypothetical protein QNJ36_19060 [Calothrix sp. MO_167.B42]|nr:hypothetical protein [Calothrix sp. MO_167.B42]